MTQQRAVESTTAAALDTWAAQKRRLLIGREESLGCTLGRLKRERENAGEGSPTLKQRWPEVYTGDGLVVQSIMCTFTELPRLVVSYYYVLKFPWRVPVREQCNDIGISRAEYWRQLDRAELAITTAMAVLSFQRPSVGTP